jgi:medium-chain acyl-[acyl-carrier-protein] hydrolase
MRISRRTGKSFRSRQIPMNTLSAIFEKELPVRYHELDSHGNVSPVTLLNYLQDTAGLHAAQLGVAVSDLRKIGLTWVLSRIHLIVTQYPRAEDTVVIRTWPATRQGLFSCREFELTGTGKLAFGRATTSWAALNINSRRPVKLEDHLPAYPLYPHRAVDDDFATLPLFPGAATAELSFRVLRGDLDTNHHVNNAIYAAWALETVPDEIAAGTLIELEISFRAEVLYGETVLSRCVVAGPGICLHQIVNHKDGRELARLRTRWTAKDTLSGGHSA